VHFLGHALGLYPPLGLRDRHGRTGDGKKSGGGKGGAKIQSSSLDVTCMCEMFLGLLATVG
jgi:hypothetical protein